MVEEGQHSEAIEAVDNLLELGPSNIEALKIKANLLGSEGKFQEECSLWHKIIEIDKEDFDAIYYFHRFHMEERENFYFTDELPMGGKRFLAHPKAMIQASLFGLVGCGVFLGLSGLAQTYPVVSSPLVTLPAFGLLVIIPWVMIVLSYFRTLREVVITPEGFFVSTRIKSYGIEWQDLKSIQVAHNPDKQKNSLTLILTPKDSGKQSICLDIAIESTVIRARSFLIRDIKRFFTQVDYCPFDQIQIDAKNCVSF